PDTPGVGSGAVVWRPESYLEVGGAEHPEAGMPPLGVIPAFYPFEDRVRQLFPGFPRLTVEKFYLHGAPERFHHRVVIAVAHRSHRAEQPSVAESFPECPGRVLRAVIGMQDGRLFVRAAPENRHADRVDDELRFLAGVD